MGLLDAVRKGEEPGREDWLREVVHGVVQELMEAEVSARIGAERYERTEERTAQRNGYHDSRSGLQDDERNDLPGPAPQASGCRAGQSSAPWSSS